MERLILGLTFVCNEDDILEQFIRHHIRFVDRLYCIVDFKTVDNTRHILSSLKSEGLNVVINEGPIFQNFDYRNWFVSQYSAYAYLFIDDDEFIVGLNPDSFKSTVRGMMAGTQLLLPWRTYIIDPRDPPNGSDPYKFTHRRVLENPQYYKSVYIRGESADVKIVGSGAHSIHAPEKTYLLNGVFIAHFPVRTYDKLLLKLVAHELYTCVFSKGTLASDFGWHIKRLFESLEVSLLDRNAFLFQEGLFYASTERDVTVDFGVAVIEETLDIGCFKAYESSTVETLNLITRMVIGSLHIFRSESERKT